MLRLKQALTDCHIPQQRLVKASGWSKTQVSLTLSSGIFPAAADRFRADVLQFVETEPAIQGWLDMHGMQPDALFASDSVTASEPTPDLQTTIYTLTGKASINGGLGKNTCMRIMKALHLLSCAVPAQLADAAAAILKGDSHVETNS